MMLSKVGRIDKYTQIIALCGECSGRTGDEVVDEQLAKTAAFLCRVLEKELNKKDE